MDVHVEPESNLFAVIKLRSNSKYAVFSASRIESVFSGSYPFYPVVLTTSI